MWLLKLLPQIIAFPTVDVFLVSTISISFRTMNISECKSAEFSWCITHCIICRIRYSESSSHALICPLLQALSTTVV